MSTPYQGWQDLANGTGFVYLTDNAGNLQVGSGTIRRLLPGKGFANDIGARDMVLGYASKFSPDPDTGDREMRVWVDANYSGAPTESVKAPQAVDISDWAFAQYAQARIPTLDVTVASNALTFDRMANEMVIRVDGGGASPANNIQEINVTGVQPEDRLILIGDVSAGNDGVLKNFVGGADNVRTRYSGTDFTLTDGNTAVHLIYDNSEWHEVDRSQVGPKEGRGIGQAVPLTPGVDSVTILAAGGTHTIAPGNEGTPPANTSYEHDVTLTGTATLSSNQTITVDTSNAIAGDKGTIYGGTSAVTLGGQQFFIGPLELSEELALSGGWEARWEYNGTTVDYTIIPSLDVANTGVIVSSMIKDLNITTAKVAAGAITDSKVASGIDGAKLSSSTVAPASLSANARRYVLTCLVSSKSGEDNPVRIGFQNFPWTLESAEYWVVADIGATDSLNLDIISPVATVSGTNHVFAAGTVAGSTSGNLTATANNTFLASEFVQIVPTKATANGGLVQVTLRCIKT